MANYWFGKPIKVNITNKANDNSGVNSIISDANDNPFALATATDVTNKGAGTLTSVATFTAITNGADNAGTAGFKTFAANTVGISVNWVSGGQSDFHKIGADIVLCREATAAKVNVNKKEVWSDETMPTVSLSATSETGTTPYKAAPFARFTSDSLNLPVPDAETSKNTFDLTLDVNQPIAASKVITFGAVTDASETPTETAAASTQITATSKTVRVKNATAAINLNGYAGPLEESSIYLKVGENKEVTYAVLPHISAEGSALYSDEVFMSTEPSIAAEAAPKTGEHIFVIRPITSGTTQLQLKSNNTSKTGGILSSILNIYVSIANVEKMLNMGDSVEVDFGSGTINSIEASKNNTDWTKINITSDSKTISVSLFDNATVANSVTATHLDTDRVKFTVGSAAQDGDYYFRINGVTLMTIYASHIAVSLA